MDSVADYLMKCDRVKGLAYSVYGVWSPRFDYPGMFISGGQTRSDATVQFIKAVEQEIKRIQTQP